jgi:hypothetical protein
MPTRSGKGFSTVPDSQPMAHSNMPKHQELALSVRTGRASKRARSASNTSDFAPEAEPSPDEASASKRSKRRKAASSHMKQALAAIVDLTRDDESGPEALGGRGRTGTSDMRPSPPSNAMDSMRHYGSSPEPTSNVFRPTTRDMQAEREAEWKRNRSGEIIEREKQTERPVPPALPKEDLKGVANLLVNDTSHPGPSLQLPHRTINKSSSVKAVSQVMVTVEEAKLYLDRASQGGVPCSHPPYTVQNGEFAPYSVTKSYHLGAMGRYGGLHRHAAPSQWVLDLKPLPVKSESAPLPNSSGYTSAMAMKERAKPSKTARKPPTPKKKNTLNIKPVPHNAYREAAENVFDWGQNYGKRFSEVSQGYIESVLGSSRLDKFLEEHQGLHEALQLYAPHHPRLPMPPSPAQVTSPPPHASPHSPRASTRGGYGHLAKLHRPSSTVARASAPAMDGCADTRTRPLEAGPYVPASSPRRGKTLDQVPMTYSKFLGHRKDEIEAYTALQEREKEALAEDYRFDFGKYKNKRLHEASDAYLSTLACSNIVGRNEILRRALFARNGKMGRSNGAIVATMKRRARSYAMD